MDSHERYMHFSTTDLSILETFDTTFKTEPFTVLHCLIRNYDKQINENTLDIKKLETFRTILCYEYQLVFNSEMKYRRRVPNDLCFKKIENVLNLKKHFQNDSDLTILYDITTLYTLLFCNLQCLEQHLTNFQRSHFIFLSENENRAFYMKILESFLDSIYLKRLLNYDTETELQLTLDLHYLQDIRIWLEMKDNRKWSTFASIFPKILKIFGSEKVLPALKSFIFIDMKDMQDQLSALSIIVDTYFSGEFKVTSAIPDTLCYDEPLWLLIIRSLKSSVQQYRKQGLFLMKRIMNFSRISDSSTLNLQKTTVVPFVCTQSVKTEISINDITEKFYLVLEALEEKQYHLIAPALTHVSNLIKGCEEHTLCNNCFSTMWLQLIFERILKHENNTVMKQGIFYICKYHKVLNNTEFLKLFINVLNNTFLYECQLYQKEPEILNEIITLFTLVRNTEVEFISRLLKVIDEETWAPIPLFYMMVIIRTVTERTLNVLVEDDLIVVKSFIQKNLYVHSRIFRVASQIELIRTISMSLDKIDNLKIVAYMLLEFPPDEAFIRSSFSWNSITMCLNTKVTKEEAASFIKVLCEDYMHQDIHLRISPRKFASIIFMLYDAELILHTKLCFADQILHKWLSLINSCDIRPYANTEHIFYIIEVMSHLLVNESVNENKRIIQLLSGHIKNVLKFLLKNSKSIPFKFGYEEVNRYMITIVSFLKHGNLILPKSEILDYVEKFKYDSITILKNIEKFTSMHYMYALYILHCTQNILNPKSTEFYVQPLINICQIHVFDNNENHKDSKGKLASYCYLLLAKLTNQFLSNVEIKLWPENVDWLKNVSHIHEMGGNEIIPEIATVLKIIVDKGGISSPENISDLKSIFTVCWRSTLLSSKNKLYFLSIKELLRVIVNNNFLALPNATNLLIHFLDELLEESNKVPKLKSILLNEMKLLNVCNLSKLQEPLLQCMLHGHALRKDKQIENQTCSYITKNFETFYPSHIPVIDHNSDASIRALSVILLHKTITADEKFASVFLPIVLQKLEEYKNKRYFNHSYTHKIKHRIMQILLMLYPVLNEVDMTNLVDLLCNLMLLESNQHSVRLMQEWLLIKIFVQNKNLRYKLWTFFEKGITKRPGCVSSIACIFYHVAKLLSKVDQCSFISVGLPYITRCCLGQQYNMRLYNQVIFMQLFKTLENLNCDDITNKYIGLYKAIIENLKDESTLKSFSRIKNDFYLFTFHALHDYSLQTIFFELPRLTDMDQSEWISPLVFERLSFKDSQNHPLQMYNLTDLLSKIETSIYIVKSTTDSEFSKKSSETDLEELSNIQKKIDPLISVNLSQNYISSSIRESISKKKLLLHEEGIIVVACLIDRTPNLGGLARTCEIFNVKELVIANLSQIRDKDFQNLSVSAENWINIREVKPHELSKYLLEKRDKGWSLIGVEQTVNSVSLLDMKFKKKSVLVLGNEKDGVPANLIPFFDTCLEIPQVGVIRSLNVHVCGAICVWQYAMQHTF